MLNAVTGLFLFPGRWEIQVNAPAAYYVSGFSGSRGSTAQPEGWNEVLVGPFGRFTATLSSGPSAIHGVIQSSNTRAAGAPVFLETWDPGTRRRLRDLRETRSDLSGNYRFDGLAPGDHRVLATYAYAAPTPQTFDAYGARAIRLDKTTDPQLDLELLGSP